MCKHPEIQIIEPCCSGLDSDGLMSCGCLGTYSVWCDDCDNKNLTDKQIEEALSEYLQTA